ncbi:MAG: iron-containing alcohol dehydrogenase [Desulfobacterales bacterium]|jgi:alcohol dehydrogenase class IV
MMQFEFATATRIIFGIGSIKEAGRHAASMGRHAFVLTGRNVDRAAPLLTRLQEKGVKHSQFRISEEPTTDLALAAVREARRQNCDLVVGIGGGSVLDTGKVAAALLTNSGDLMDYLEVIGAGRPLQHASAAYIAVPTTAGTGAEVTRNAVLDSPAHHVKVSMRSPYMLPKLALVDPELTFTMPPSITASTGLDAFTQLLEAFVSHQANPLTDAVCREGLQRAARSLKKAYLDGHSADARCDMSLASLFGGLALANAKLGAVHGFAGPLGGMYTASHGALCAGLLPHVMDVNVKALRSRSPQSKALDRYNEIACMVTGIPTAQAFDGIAWVRDLCLQLNVPPLADHGIKDQDFPAIVDKACKASSMKGNPIELTTDELLEILQRAV